MMKKTVLITLTYNKLEQATKPYLDSLYKFTDENSFDLVIVDNASSDGTVEYIKDFAKTHNNLRLKTTKIQVMRAETTSGLSL